MRRYLILLLTVLAAPAYAAEAVLRLKPAQLTALIGSPFEIVGEAELPPSHALRPPGADAQRGDFEIVSVKFGMPRSENGRKFLPVVIRASAFALGKQTLPAMQWKLLGPDGTVSIIESPPIQVTITPPKPGTDETGDIRPIKGPYAPPLWPWLLIATLILLAAGAALYWFYLRRRAKDATKKSSEPADTRSFEEIALDDIEALPGLGLPTKEFYDQLSDIVRLYLERRCGIAALKMTSCDLLREMRRTQTDTQARNLMKKLLEHCDLAKFARHQPQDSQYPADCAVAKEIICVLSPKKREAGEVRDFVHSGGKA